jgi:hypothetical protein
MEAGVEIFFESFDGLEKRLCSCEMTVQPNEKS